MAWPNMDERQEMVKFLMDMGVTDREIKKTCSVAYECSTSAINADLLYFRDIIYWGVTPKMKRFIQERDNYTCQYCGVERPDNSVIEHVVPWALGGHHKPYNLVFACHLCNTTKRRSVWVPLNLDQITNGHPEWREKVLKESKK